jgi:hypothetical protein
VIEEGFWISAVREGVRVDRERVSVALAGFLIGFCGFLRDRDHLRWVWVARLHRRVVRRLPERVQVRFSL